MNRGTNIDRSEQGKSRPTGARRSGIVLHPRSVLVSFASVFVLFLAFASASFGEASGPPQFASSLEASQVHATRALLHAVASEQTTIKGHFVVQLSSISASGPWLTVASLSCKAINGNPKGCNISVENQHLTPATTYYARVEVSDELGSAESTTKFTTTAVSAPEIVEPYLEGGGTNVVEEEGRALRPVEVGTGGEGPEIGPTFAEFLAEIQTDGIETAYHFEYATSEAALEEGKGTPVAGGSGSITVAEDFADPVAHLTGLTPGTTYFVRVVASNTKGVAKRTTRFETPTGRPPAFTTGVSGVTETSAHVEGSVVPESAETQWHFEYANSEGGPWTPVAGASGTITAAEADQKPHEVAGVLDGLNPATTYYVRLFAENTYGHTTSVLLSDDHFETAGPPVAVTFATHGIHGETMRALGSVLPHGYDAHYDFQYVSQKHFEAEGFANPEVTPELDAGGGSTAEGEGVYSPVVVGADLPGLRAGETYRYRTVATSTAPGDPVVDGGEQVLTIPPATVGAEEACPNQAFRVGPSALLPDCRAYEQVTPTEKGGAQDAYGYGGTRTYTTVGEDGDHVDVRTLAKWGSSAGDFWTDYVFSRGADGWQMTSVTPQPQAGEQTYEAEIFSPDLTDIGVLSYTETQLERLSPSVQLGEGPVGGPYTPVVSGSSRGSVPGHVSLEWAGASVDFSTLVLRSEDHELLGHATGTSSGYDLYEYAGGQLRQLNVLSGGAPIGSCGAAIVSGGLEGEDNNTQFIRNARHAVSADGSRVFFEAVPGSDCSAPKQLYMRMDGSETLDIGAYVFRGANAEGTQLLLENEDNGTHEVFLYDTEARTITHIFSVPRNLENEGYSAVLSEGFKMLYFKSSASLTGEAPSGVTPAENFYRYDIAGHTLHYLFTADGEGSTGGGIYASPNGQDLYFASVGVVGLPAPGQNQVYRYDVAEGVVQCMSCASSFDPEPKLGSTFIEEGGEAMRAAQPLMRVSSDNGDYVFFDTPDELVPQDINGEEEPDVYTTSLSYSHSSDVYEWRRDGVDGCVHVQGCVGLITDGRDGLKNMFLGTDPSGGDVFFASHSQLAASDQDNAGDVYDARVDGGFAPPAPGPVECEGDACSTPLGAPLDVTPASLTFSGTGDLVSGPPVPASAKAKAKKKVVRCAKGRKPSRGRCVKAKTVKRKARGGKSSRAGSRKGGRS